MEGKKAVGIGGVTKYDYEENLEEAKKRADCKEENGVVSCSGENGEFCYYFTVGSDAYVMIEVAAGVDAEDVFSRISTEPENGF